MIAVSLSTCQRLTPLEKKVVGSWQWTYIEGVGRMVFTPDHKVKSGFPPEDQDGRKLADDQFVWFDEGTWHVDGDVLVMHTNNRPYVALQQRLLKDQPEEIRQRHHYPVEEKTERHRIVSIDDQKMVCDDRYQLERVKR